MIEIKLEDSFSSTTRPYIKVKLSDIENFDNLIELKALIDTGADISFINEKHFRNFNFLKKWKEEMEKSKLYIKPLSELII